MFQTQWHLWLQHTFDASWVLAVMQFISLLGYEMAYTALILVCAFGIRLRAGLSVMLAVLLMACATHAIKQSAALPRPSDVDAAVLDKGEPSHPFVVDGGGRTFWSLPDAQATAMLRAQPDADYGFNSGHVGVATAACVGLLLAFGIRRRWLRGLLALGSPLLMALSRMYLGRHFLADVLAGWLIGLGVALLAWQLMPGLRGARRWQLPVLLGLGVALAWASLWTPLVPLGEASRLLALALLVGWLQWRGWPVDPQSMAQRVLRVLGAVVVYLLARSAIEWLAYRIPLPDAPITELLWHTVGTLLILGGGVALARWIPRQRRPVQ
ncbi:TPA: phosphatase PAP2 family protein [Stenotrophomonas maltophilia]|nr:phosphatase PAP2 family protein [Stenotrophomonas maltophilia]HDS1025894.1 phosphatase PAP2 family protein [Stenotrophomonas maltophilia]HDS1031594.1 phosphatase PAP2 family protein [Stenotrophomonas maltophilia]HDS1032583.1 phosphatase PAP2 family protein [Stenotrophomonas maltophilia]HDS1034656.1 phosphatase PAP2 family protein [Stenotrophomonas maltophilia]